VVASSICGTDLGLLGVPAAPFVLGHEFAGTVDGVAYSVEPTYSCQRCDQCRAGSPQRCTGEHRNLGIFTDGGLCERIVVRPENLVALPAGLSAGDACLVEPAAVSLHGLHRAAVVPGERIVVVGAGSIGLLAVAAARHLGHEVDAQARHPAQREAAERLGAGQPHGQYDVVIEATGTASGIEACAELARPGARVVLLGVFHGAVPVPGGTTLVKELSWIGAMAYGRHGGVREVDAAAALLSADPEIARTVITHRFPLADAPEAFRTAGDRAAGALKVVLHP
jgi:threonine dehydrogenase-like Zn-dependent dehydrogenase